MSGIGWAGIGQGRARRELRDDDLVASPLGDDLLDLYEALAKFTATQRTAFIPAYVERVTRSGTFSKFTTQLHVNDRKDTQLTTLGITAGSDGNLWITEAPGEHGPGVGGTYEILQLVVSRSTPDGTKGGHKTKHQKPRPKPHPKPKPSKRQKPKAPHGHGSNRSRDQSHS